MDWKTRPPSGIECGGSTMSIYHIQLDNSCTAPPPSSALSSCRKCQAPVERTLLSGSKPKRQGRNIDHGTAATRRFFLRSPKIDPQAMNSPRRGKVGMVMESEVNLNSKQSLDFALYSLTHLSRPSRTATWIPEIASQQVRNYDSRALLSADGRSPCCKIPVRVS